MIHFRALCLNTSTTINIPFKSLLSLQTTTQTRVNTYELPFLVPTSLLQSLFRLRDIGLHTFLFDVNHSRSRFSIRFLSFSFTRGFLYTLPPPRDTYCIPGSSPHTRFILIVWTPAQPSPSPFKLFYNTNHSDEQWPMILKKRNMSPGVDFARKTFWIWMYCLWTKCG